MHKLFREYQKNIATLEDADVILDKYISWRGFFRNLLPENRDREAIYQ